MFGRRNKKRRHSEKKSKGLFLGQMLVGACLALFIFFVAAFVWYGTRLESLTITTVQVEGGETLDHAAAKAIAEEELRGDYYRMVPRRFAWAYPEERIIERVKGLPKVKSVSVLKVESDTILLTLSEYQPYALWCADSETASSTNPCAYIDEDGYAFVLSPELSGSSFLRFKNGNTPRVGDAPFSRVFLKESHIITKEVGRRHGWKVVFVERVGFEEASFHLEGGGVLKTTLRQSSEDTLNNLGVIVASEEFKHLTPDAFQYIDLRFGDKVFVNEDGGLKDDEAIATSTATSTEEQ